MQKVIGHRGLRSLKNHENSMSALLDACEHLDGVETDLVSSKDGIGYLIHESSLTKLKVFYNPEKHLSFQSVKLMAGRRFDQLNSEILDQITLIDGSKLPRLDFFLDQAFDKNKNALINIELKGYGSDLALAKALKNRKNDVLISSSGLSLIKKAQSIIKKDRATWGFIVEPPDYKKLKMMPWIHGDENYYLPLSKDTINSIESSNLAIDFIVSASNTIDYISKIQQVSDYLKSKKLAFWTSSGSVYKDQKASQIIELSEKVGVTASVVIVDSV